LGQFISAFDLQCEHSRVTVERTIGEQHVMVPWSSAGRQRTSEVNNLLHVLGQFVGRRAVLHTSTVQPPAKTRSEFNVFRRRKVHLLMVDVFEYECDARTSISDAAAWFGNVKVPVAARIGKRICP
jgi:hypothetical protein